MNTQTTRFAFLPGVGRGTLLFRPLVADRYLDCTLTRAEKWLMFSSLTFSVVLQLSPVLSSALGGAILLLFSLSAWLSPISGFFYIAAAQSLPFPEGIAYNPAQLGFLTWIPIVLLRYRRLRLQRLVMLWPLLPFLIWFAYFSGEAWGVFHPQGAYMLAVYYSVIACQLANESNGRYLKCLLGLSLGALMVATGYWEKALGLPVELSGWGGARGGFVRLGGVRADSVMLWPAMLMGSFGLVGIAATLMVLRRGRRETRWIANIAMASFVLSIPPLVSTMAHGAVIGFSAMTAFLMIVVFDCVRKRILDRTATKRIAWAVTCSTVLLALLFGTNCLHIADRARAVGYHYGTVKEDFGVAGSRGPVWEASWRTMRQYPWFGVRHAGGRETIYGMYEERDRFLSHNVFLDYARACGTPGMVLLAVFFFYPSANMWSWRNLIWFLPFLLVFLAMWLFWMGLSFQFYKTFWAFWMLMAMAGSEIRKQKRRGRW